MTTKKLGYYYAYKYKSHPIFLFSKYYIYIFLFFKILHVHFYSSKNVVFHTSLPFFLFSTLLPMTKFYWFVLPFNLGIFISKIEIWNVNLILFCLGTFILKHLYMTHILHEPFLSSSFFFAFLRDRCYFLFNFLFYTWFTFSFIFYLQMCKKVVKEIN
jgi:hypothetical protein